MKLIANHDGERKDGILVAYRVAADTIIYKGAMVCLNTNGYAIPAADEPGLKFVGFAYERGDNLGRKDGEITARVWKDGSFRVKFIDPDLMYLGFKAYILDDNRVALATENGVSAGTLVEFPRDEEGKFIDVARVLIRNAVV